MGILLIVLGIIVAIAVLFMVTVVIGGPWTYGFDVTLIFIWMFYILLQFIVPAMLIIYGISLL